MQIVFQLHGVREKVEKTLRCLEWCSFNLPIYRDEIKIANKVIFGGIRPMPGGFYSYHFPKAYLDQVLSALTLPNEMKYSNSSYSNLPLWALRKGFKLKKLPKPDEKKGAIPLFLEDTNVIGVGFLEDKDIHDERQNITYEGI